ncbi:MULTISPECIES: alkaline phosphatase [Kordiimonas]|jgi:alkaline phosphatase|uniref:alkaline phosphatase n=1 Tax=Kordiimonas TaxID=288021 RepID=UPI0025797D90|nr:alkaline phosphatase [Kordiimonas sp. UBA4487]
MKDKLRFLKGAALVALLVGATAAQADEELADRLARLPNTRQAKNVILIIGDGMGPSTVTAGRILEGQLRGETGEENFLSFETFPYTSLVKTYNVNAQVPDSAGTASALNTGVKTNIGTMGLSADQPTGVCEGASDHVLKTLAEYAEEAGMATGIVTTARVTHATPGAVYGHVASRSWENDTDLPDDAQVHGCKDLARQLVEFPYGDGIDVALGGGRQHFLPEGLKGGDRGDKRNLLKEWQVRHPNGRYVEDAVGLAALDLSSGAPVLGLFDSSHIPYVNDRGDRDVYLPAMAEAAIRTLSHNPNGYYLMIEAGRIDHGHHKGNAYQALHEVVELSATVRRVMDLVDPEETLVIVTADHSHVFTISGYPNRGNPILGLMHHTGSLDGKPVEAKDGKPFTTLGYYTGPGAVKHGARETLTEEMVQDPDFSQQALVPLGSETHGGEDVGLYAIGPWAHLVSGTMEQNLVFHIMEHALNLKARSVPKD